MSEVSEIKQCSRALLYRIVMIAAVGGFLFGYDMALISGASLFLQAEWGLNEDMLGSINASAGIGCPIGAFLGLWLADSWGRNKALILSAFLFLASGVGCAVSNNQLYSLGFADVLDFNFWRIVGGAGVGLASTVSPMYIAEISPAHLRGRMVVINQLANVTGIVLSAVVSWFLSKDGISYEGDWRSMFMTLVIPSVLLLIGLMTVPKSPRWLALKGQDKEALDVLTLVNGKEKAEVELKEIKNELGVEEGGWKELFQPGVKTALIVGITLMVFSQTNGVNMILGYGPKLFKEASAGQMLGGKAPHLVITQRDGNVINVDLSGSLSLKDVAEKINSERSLVTLEKNEGLKVETLIFKDASTPKDGQRLSITGPLASAFGVDGSAINIPATPTASDIIYGSVNNPFDPYMSNADAILSSTYLYIWITFTTIMSFWLTAKFGRRPILIWGVLAMGLGHVIMYLKLSLGLPIAFAHISMNLAAGAATLTLFPLSWVILSEIFPNRVRGKAMSIATVIMFVASYTYSRYFPNALEFFKNQFGTSGGLFIVFAFICSSCAFFVWKWLPETKDKTLEEIANTWLAKK